MAPTVKFQRMYPSVRMPRYMTPGAAGMDVCALEGGELPPGESAAFRTGLMAEVPPGWEIQVRPRSGLAARHGITVLNSPGTVDADFRGEIGVLLINTSEDHYDVKAGERIAQLVVAPAPQAEVVEVGEVGATERGGGGFGSTGK